MPIRIYHSRRIGDNTLALLCEGCWSLPEQIDALEQWLADKQVGKDWPKTTDDAADYVADVGFSVR